MAASKYPCNKLGCERPGTRWIRFGSSDPCPYCNEHFDAIFRHANDYEPRDKPAASSLPVMGEKG